MAPLRGPVTIQTRDPGEPIDPASWEWALGRLVTGQSVEGKIGAELARDPAIPLVEALIHEFRGSMVVDLLPLTARLLMLALGVLASRVVFRDYWSRTQPQMYASAEAAAFGRYLGGLDLKIPWLTAVLTFERAVLDTLVDGQTRVVSFDIEPLPLLRALAEGRLPDVPLAVGLFEIEVTPENTGDLRP